MGNLALKYKLNPLFWLEVRRYKKLILESPNDLEVQEMAQKTGNVRGLWELEANMKGKK